MGIRHFVVKVAGAGLIVSSAAVWADTAQGPLEEIIVTATKRDEKLHDVAMSITALGGDQLALRQLTGFQEWAAQVPGLSLQTSDPAFSRLILRGENVGSAGATIATTVDDIPFFMSGAQADGAFFSANVDTYDLQRIEVLRGPQGTLYGAAAEGGIVKYVTNPPNLNKFEGGVSLGGESVDGGSLGGNIKGFVNLPFWDNKAALRVSAVQERLPGWIDNPQIGDSDVNKGDSYSLRGSLLVQPTSDFSARLSLFEQHLKTHGNSAVEVVGAALHPQAAPANQFDRVDGFVNNNGVPLEEDNSLKYAALNMNYDFHWATLLSATSYGRFNIHFFNNLSNANLAPGFTYADFLSAPPRAGGVYGQPVVFGTSQIEYVHKLNQELRLSSDPGNTLFGHGFDWQIGGFYTRELTTLTQPFEALSASDPSTVLAPPVGGAIVPGDYKETSYFADITYHFNTAFDLELGGRGTDVKQHSQVTTLCCVLYGPVTTTFPTQFSSQTNTTWSVAPRWHITQDTLAYVRVATGFRPGGPNLPVPALPNPPVFKSDSTKNYEIGLRTDLFDKTLSVDMAVFYIDWKDVQIVGIVNTPTGPVGIDGNSGSAKSKGVEWNFAWRPVSGLTLALLGSYTDAYLTSDALALGAHTGDKLPYVPNVSATLNADYRWPAFGSYSAYVGASESYTGTRYTAFSPSVTIINPHVKLPVYNTLQLRVGVDNDRYSAQLYGNNITNSRGIQDYSSEGGANETGTASFIQPRTIGIELGVKF
ncbi:MAG TPA: TonB-dependent receptor [Steroidobacteraceae bacterium]|nr:TonB-dependent receptor [Steroidobacteraceae bacterium]